ncbi:MAG: chitobiase/beta-hexosaminidase C-terminal domain-containing protein [Planctomycetes bacterium]|nr:chitobiase/beta-hexosaminidase C-terminal domain-containing protein [Planctomycetota bacterium]
MTLPRIGSRFSLALSGILISSVMVSAQDGSLDVPKIERQADGTVTISAAAKGAVVRYSLDGSDPVQRSGPYLAPIALPQGGVVKARTFTEDRKQHSAAAEVKFDPLPGSKPLPSTLVTCTQDRDWPIYDWAQRHAAVSSHVQEHQSTLVFIGDSITQMFGGVPHDRGQPGREVWDKYYGNRNAANLGFGYDYLENTLWRLQHGELKGAKAKAIVIHIGTNNLGKNTPEEIALGVRAICDEVHHQQPQARILLMAILPRGAKPDATRTKLNDVNQLLAKFDGQNGITFLDAGARFLQPDGSLPRELMGDFLHPTAKGYEIWAEAMEPTLKQWLQP